MAPIVQKDIGQPVTVANRPGGGTVLGNTFLLQQPDDGDMMMLHAAESANSSREGGSMATMLARGIPGGGATAILPAAFAMHNVVGGPRCMEESRRATASPRRRWSRCCSRCAGTS